MNGLNQDHIYKYVKENINNQSLTDIINYLLKDHTIEDIEIILQVEFNIELEDDSKKESKDSRQDEEFKKAVKTRYNNKCIITGHNVVICDVAHIIEFSKCKTLNEKYDINNGLLLSTEMHRLFNIYYFSINPDTLMIEIDKTKDGINNVGLLDYDNKKLDIDNNSIKYLRHHYIHFYLVKTK